MISHYEHISRQRSRLGSYELYGLGEASIMPNPAAGIISAIGNTISNILAITLGHDTRKRELKTQKHITSVTIAGQTKQLEISTKAGITHAQIGVERIKTKYGSINKLVVTGGIILALIMITGTGGYIVAKKVTK